MGEALVEDDRRFLPRNLYERVDADTLKFVADSAHVIGAGATSLPGCCELQQNYLIPLNATTTIA